MSRVNIYKNQVYLDVLRVHVGDMRIQNHSYLPGMFPASVCCSSYIVLIV